MSSVSSGWQLLNVNSSIVRAKTGRWSLFVGAAAFLLLSFGLTSPSNAQERVRFALNWLISGKNAGYFVARDKGFYKEVGLDVTISRGNGSGDTIKRIAAGESDFGLADTASIIGAIGNDNSPVKMVGMVFSKSSVAVVYTDNIGIKTPKDLIGRKLARSASGASPAMFPGFLKANGIDRSSLEEVVVGASSFIPLLLARSVDAVVDQSSYLGRYNSVGASKGMSFKAFRFVDFGLDLYGDAIFVSRATLEQKQDIIRRFMAATLRGNLYAFENPKEAIEILRRNNPEIEAEVGLNELLDTKELALTPEVKANGYGYIGLERMGKTISIVKEYIGLKRQVEAKDVFTLDFIKSK